MVRVLAPPLSVKGLPPAACSPAWRSFSPGLTGQGRMGAAPRCCWRDRRRTDDLAIRRQIRRRPGLNPCRVATRQRGQFETARPGQGNSAGVHLQRQLAAVLELPAWPRRIIFCSNSQGSQPTAAETLASPVPRARSSPLTSSSTGIAGISSPPWLLGTSGRNGRGWETVVRTRLWPALVDAGAAAALAGGADRSESCCR